MVADWYLENLVCPVDGGALTLGDKHLVSQSGRQYPVIDGIPVMLTDTIEPTMGIMQRSLERARGNTEFIDQRAPELYLETLGISEAEKKLLVERADSASASLNPVVSVIVGATSGYAYSHLVEEGLQHYPIPEISLPESSGERLLDIGCNWGRWSIAAARKGYQVVGIDPSLGAVIAARDIARQLGHDIHYIVADARQLPFKDESFSVCYSYSVLQHFSQGDFLSALNQAGRVLKSGGMAKIQVANKYGIRSLQHQYKRGFGETSGFQVRYYSVREFRKFFADKIGPTKISSDCFFGLGWQFSDFRFVRTLHRPILIGSEFLRRASQFFTPLVQVSDSVFATSRKAART